MCIIVTFLDLDLCVICILLKSTLLQTVRIVFALNDEVAFPADGCHTMPYIRARNMYYSKKCSYFWRPKRELTTGGSGQA